MIKIYTLVAIYSTQRERERERERHYEREVKPFLVIIHFLDSSASLVCSTGCYPKCQKDTQNMALSLISCTLHFPSLSFQRQTPSITHPHSYEISLSDLIFFLWIYDCLSLCSKTFVFSTIGFMTVTFSTGALAQWAPTFIRRVSYIVSDGLDEYSDSKWVPEP